MPLANASIPTSIQPNGEYTCKIEVIRFALGSTITVLSTALSLFLTASMSPEATLIGESIIAGRGGDGGASVTPGRLGGGAGMLAGGGEGSRGCWGGG